MRFAAYAGASTALAAAVVLRAFHQRPNFFSASVYLAQSQACRMILLNLVLLCVYSVVRALQKLLYGPLRPIEREQLWDRSWYAVTETALAMTIFRDEVGIFFMFMFVTLLVGKIWGWISEGRVEVFEQQPPSNPRLFHTRLIASLILSELFDLAMLQYCVQTVVNHPRRPGMMVMFAFEFAILLVSSTSTTARYLLSLQESLIVKKQTAARVEERREEIRTARQEAVRQAEANGSEDILAATANMPREEDVDDNDIDVPGWQEKGRWLLLLDLLTDLFKLVIYVMFFTMLLLFHGIPIHIIRDVYVTARSFIKRINDFNKYRNATRDMNARYADATAEELQRDGTCIICREDMRPWQQPPPPPPPPPPNNAAANEAAGQQARANRVPPDERQRPKKLPCGHILHLGCLKSWLERQQVCPTCRTSVLVSNTTSTAARQQNLPLHLQQAVEHAQRAQQARNDQQPQPGEQAPQVQPDGGNGDQPNAAFGGNNPQNQQAPQPPNQNNQNAENQNQGARARTFALGPFRFTFAAGNANEVQNMLQRQEGQEHGQDQGGQQANANGARAGGGGGGGAPAVGTRGLFNLLRRWAITRDANNGTNPAGDGMRSVADIQRILLRMEDNIVDSFSRLRLTQAQLSTMRAFQDELARYRALQAHPRGPGWYTHQQVTQMQQQQQGAGASGPPLVAGIPPLGMPTPGLAFPGGQAPGGRPNQSQMIFSGSSQTQALGPGDPSLPEGLTLPEGYTLLPLQRHNPPMMENTTVAQGNEDLSVAEVTPQVDVSVATDTSSSQPNTETQDHSSVLAETDPTTSAIPEQRDGESAQQSSSPPNWSQSGPSAENNALSSQSTNGETSNNITVNGTPSAAMSAEPSSSNPRSEPEVNGRDKRKQPTVEDADDVD